MAAISTAQDTFTDSQLPYYGGRMNTGTITSCSSIETTMSAQMVFDQNSTISSGSSYRSTQQPNDWDGSSTGTTSSRVAPIENEYYMVEEDSAIETCQSVQQHSFQKGRQRQPKYGM